MPLHPRQVGAVRRRAVAVGVAVLSLIELGCAQVIDRPDVLIGTADPTGIYYPLGGSICRLFNLETERHRLRCSEAPSSGSMENIGKLRSGAFDAGIVQSDVLAEAVADRGQISAVGRGPGLRILFAGHDEMLTIVAHRGSGIRSLADLRGKRINIGNPGSGQRESMERVLYALGLARHDFSDVRELTPAEQSRAFCANELDAIVYSVAHPNGLVRDVLRTCGGVLVDASGPDIEGILSGNREYEHTAIPGGAYQDNPADVRTFGVRAVVVTTHRMSDATAYELTRAVFDNFDDFRRLHPAFEHLTVADMLQSSGRVALHPGALRYYRERGWLP
jgi:TRAP transporter TAXI family solute receptor